MKHIPVTKFIPVHGITYDIGIPYDACDDHNSNVNSMKFSDKLKSYALKADGAKLVCFLKKFVKCEGSSKPRQ